MIVVAVALAGGLGAVARFVLDGWIRSRTRLATPWGIALINVSGALALGLVGGLAARQLVDEPLSTVLGIGFLGGYTTFSTASLETVRLLQSRRWISAAAYGLGTLVLAIGAAAAGWTLARIG